MAYSRPFLEKNCNRTYNAGAAEARVPRRRSIHVLCNLEGTRGSKADKYLNVINPMPGISPLSGLIQHLALKPIYQNFKKSGIWLQAITDSPSLPIFLDFQTPTVQLYSFIPTLLLTIISLV